MIKTRALYYTYAELDSSVVAKGQHIDANQTIGFSAAKEIDFMINNRRMRFIGNTEVYVDCRCKVESYDHHSDR